MPDEKYKAIKIDGEEYLKLAKIADQFVQKGSVETNPILVIIMGIVAVGKSTERKNKYANGYVFIDAGAIYQNLTENETKKSEQDVGFCQVIGDMIITKTIEDKRNIVIELLGDNENHSLDKIIKGMEANGYKVEVLALLDDPMKCYQRHLKQEEEGRDDISSFHTQEATMQIFTNYFIKI